MLGETLKELRKRNKLSLRKLEKLSGVSHSHISQIENNHTIPSREKLIAMAKVLKGTTEEELLRLAGYLPTKMDTVKELPRPSVSVFYSRFKKSLEESNTSIEQIACRCSLDPKIIIDWLQNESYSSNKTIPSLTTIYKIAIQLGVTSDYLLGYSNAPTEMNVYGPRPKNLREFLDKEDIVFDSIPLDQNDKKKLKKIIYTVFGDDY